MKLWIAIALVLGSSAPALACDLYACGDPPLVLPVNDVVPANAFAFGYGAGPSEGLRLIDDASGNEIASSMKWAGEDSVWSPDATLREGQRVRIEWRYACDGDPVTAHRTFVLGPPASFDRKATLVVLDEHSEAPHGARSKSVDLRYDAPTTFEGFLRLDVEVDGYPHDANQSNGFAGNEQIVQLHTWCDRLPTFDTTCGGYNWLTPRQHEVKFIARALGTDMVDTQTLTVDLRCEAQDEEDDSGCQLGASQGGAWMGLALLWRRRRRQGTSSPSAASTSARV